VWLPSCQRLGAGMLEKIREILRSGGLRQLRSEQANPRTKVGVSSHTAPLVDSPLPCVCRVPNTECRNAVVVLDCTLPLHLLTVDGGGGGGGGTVLGVSTTNACVWVRALDRPSLRFRASGDVARCPPPTCVTAGTPPLKTCGHEGCMN